MKNNQNKVNAKNTSGIKNSENKSAVTKAVNTLSKHKKTIAALAVALIIVVTVSLIFIDILNENGVIIRAKKVKKSDDISINGAMMTFYFWDCFNSSLQSNESYYRTNGLLSAANLDDPDPLGNPWRNTFEKTTIEIADLYMTYAQYAVDNNITLSSELLEKVESEVKKFKDKAVVYGMSTDKFLSKYYGRGVKESDVRDAITLAYLSTEGFNAMYDSVDVTDERITDYFNNNKQEFQRTDYCFFTTGISGKDNLTEDEKKYYSEKAEYIANSSSVDEFKERVGEYIIEQNNRLPFDSGDRLSGTELDEYVKNSIESVVCENISYNDKIGFHSWVFSDDRIPGDSFVNHVEPYGTYGAIYIITPIYIDSEWRDQAITLIIQNEIQNMIDNIDEQYPATSADIISSVSGIK